MREANATLRAVVEALPLAVIAIDAKGSRDALESCGRAHVRMDTKRTCSGGRCRWCPRSKRRSFGSRVSMTLAGHLETGFETERLRRDGTLVSVSVSTAPLRDAAGDITGALAIIEDITESKRAERELARFYAEANHAGTGEGRVPRDTLARAPHTDERPSRVGPPAPTRRSAARSHRNMRSKSSNATPRRRCGLSRTSSTSRGSSVESCDCRCTSSTL